MSSSVSVPDAPALLPGPRGRVADMLFAMGAVKFGGFTLKVHRTQPDLPLSPYYFDCRGAGHPTKPGPVPDLAVGYVAALMTALFDGDEIDSVEGVATVPHGATPYAERVAELLGVPLIRLTKRENPDGTTTVDGIEGDVEAVRWSHVLLVEDVVTTGASSAEAIAVLADNQIFVTEAFAVIDREQGGVERLAAMNVRLRPLLTFTGLLDHYLARRTIEPAMYAASHAYHRASIPSP